MYHKAKKTVSNGYALNKGKKKTQLQKNRRTMA